MSRKRMVTAVQKTYDDSYLSCSTAVFYESQGNETEATRYWKSALDQILDHHTRQAQSITRSTQAEKEKALAEALKELELQCRERVNILEALKASRQSIIHADTSINGSLGSNSIGQGTIPAVTYSQLSRPVLPNPHSSSPQRPSGNPKTGVVDILDAVRRQVSSPTPSSPNHGLKQGKTSGPSSLEKYSMRTTLRSAKVGEKLNKGTARLSKSDGEGSSKAATLAWNTFQLRDSLHQSPLHDASYTPSGLSLRPLADQLLKTRSTPYQLDKCARRLVSSSDKEPFSSNPTRTPIISRQFIESSSSQPSLLSVSAATNALGTFSNSESFALNNSHRLSGQYATSQSMIACSTSPKVCGEDSKATSSDININNNTDNNIYNDSNNHNSETPEKRRVSGMPYKSDITRNPVGRSSSSELAKSQYGRFRRYERSKSQHSPLSQSSDNHKDRSQCNTPPEGKHCSNLRSEGKGQEGASPGDITAEASWVKRKSQILKNLPPGIDDAAARQILNEILGQGDEVYWGDIAGLKMAKNALRETVVYPFLRPDLFMGLREPARGMLLFGPPGTGKTMLARAVATESRSTFFSISASSLTSKYLGESEKLVKALFILARVFAPSIIFVDEIDSLLTQRSGSGDNEATRRIKTEFLIQWSDLQRAAAGRELTERDKERGDANRVLVLAATNLPWAIDEAARRRFVRRQYIPLPEPTTRETQLRTLLGQQKHVLSTNDLNNLVQLTDGFSGSDITALAKDAAMGPLRSLGEALLHTTTEEIRPIQFADFQASLGTIRPSVGKKGLEKYEAWAKEFGERGG